MRTTFTRQNFLAPGIFGEGVLDPVAPCDRRERLTMEGVGWRSGRTAIGNLVFFLDASQRIYGILWSLCGLRDARAKSSFRTINVQWIGQWGLFSRCGSSWNQ